MNLSTSSSQAAPPGYLFLKARANRAKQTASSSPSSFAFRGAALRLQSIRADEVIISGPSETGKTLAALAHIDSLARAYPRATGAIVRKVRRDMDSTVLKLWRDAIVSRGGIETFGGEHPEFYAYPNGSRVYVGGMDRPGKVLSGALDFCYLNQAEEFMLGDWETFSTRTTGRAGVIVPGLLLGDCNPGSELHWILQRARDGYLTLLESRHEDNPTLYDDAGSLTEQGARTMRKLDALTGVRKERLRFGRWVSAEGAVYEFDRAVHLIDRFDIPADWRRIRVIDFGYTNPFVCGWWAFDPDGRMYLYREIYMTRRTVNAHAPLINRLSEGEAIEATICDHDAEDRATLAEYGISTQAAIKDVSRGIQAVQERLQIAGDGKPRLLMMRDALAERDESLADDRKPVCTLDEFDAYMWPKSQDGKPIKEQPVKTNDHGMDMTRYAAMYLDHKIGSLVSFG